MGQDDIGGLIRHALTTLGGGLVANGLLTSDQLSNAVGALVVLGGLIWSIYQKRAQRKAVVAAASK